MGAWVPPVAGEVLNTEPAEKVTASFEFLVHPFEHAQSKLAVALDSHHPRVRKPAGGVTFEFDALLEIDQAELDLIGAAPQREVGDDDMEERGLAGTGLARNENMLPGAPAQGEVLEFGGASSPDRDTEFGASIQRP